MEAAPRPRGRPSRRADLLATAMRVLVERGIRDMTLEEVSAAAGLTRGAIYWHFVSKERLVEETLAATRLPLEGLQRLSEEDPCLTLARALGDSLSAEPSRRFCQMLVLNAGDPMARARGARIHRAVTRFMNRHCMPGDSRPCDGTAVLRGHRQSRLRLGQALLLGLLVQCSLSRQGGAPDPAKVAAALRKLLGTART